MALITTMGRQSTAARASLMLTMPPCIMRNLPMGMPDHGDPAAYFSGANSRLTFTLYAYMLGCGTGLARRRTPHPLFAGR
jgi:hypothetical protein